MKKRRTLEDVVSRSITRALVAMQDESDRPAHRYRGGEINGWTGANLASYITPKVLRMMRAYKIKKAPKS